MEMKKYIILVLNDWIKLWRYDYKHLRLSFMTFDYACSEYKVFARARGIKEWTICGFSNISFYEPRV